MLDLAIGTLPQSIEVNSLKDRKPVASKKEFEEHLRKAKKDDPQEAKVDQKEDASKNTSENEKLSQTDKKKSKQNEKDEKGEIKKKIKLENYEMILNGMASNENMFKILDSEVNLDNLKNFSTISSNLHQNESAADASAFEILAEAPKETAVTDDISQLPSIEAKTELEPKNQLEIQVDPLVSNDFAEESQNQSSMVELKKFESADSKTELQTATESGVYETILIKNAVSSNPQLESNDQDENEKKDETSDFDPNQNTDSSKLSKGPDSRQQETDFKLNTNVEKKAATLEVKSESQNSAQVNQILQQAKYLITRGGGEVTVTMTPEGLGEVHLKVILENGKMNLELNTQDKAVESLIKDSLAHLRSSLADQQINVEHVTLNNKMNSVQGFEKLAHSDQTSNATQSQNQSSLSQQSQNSFDQSRSQQQQEQNQRTSEQKYSDSIKSTNLADLKIGLNKAAGQRVYQSHKAQALDRVA